MAVMLQRKTSSFSDLTQILFVFASSSKNKNRRHRPFKFLLFLLQKLPIVKETLTSLPSAMIQTQDSGCLMILTSGSVILVTLELMFS